MGSICPRRNAVRHFELGGLGAPPLGERVESNEVRARERLLPPLL